MSLPPPTHHTPSQDLHKQAANGIAELVQARASLITQQSDWSILFTIIEFIGLGISSTQSNDMITMETATEDTTDSPRSHDSVLQSDSSEMQKEFVAVMETPVTSSFDLFTEPVLPVHEPQVSVCTVSIASFTIIMQRTATCAYSYQCHRLGYRAVDTFYIRSVPSETAD